jgi:phage terminase large subunit GpA-like protein
VAGKGVVVKWERIRRTNEWLDALGYACAAASSAGVRLIDEAQTSDSSRVLGCRVVSPRRSELFDETRRCFLNAVVFSKTRQWRSTE